MKLQIGTAADFEMVFQDMCKQFPKEERKSKQHISTLIESGKCQLLLAFDGDHPVAYVIACPFQNFLWLDYIAVFQEYQSQGYGSRIFPLLPDIYPGLKGIFLEVEHEDPQDISTVRRIRFYRRLGAQMIWDGYRLPVGEEGLPMGLFFLPFDKQLPGKKEIFDIIQYVFDLIHSDVAKRGEILRKMKARADNIIFSPSN